MQLPSVKQAFAIHLFISVIIFLILIYLMMKVWFPDDLFFIDGGWQGLKIIAPVDLILGPALTLILYRPWKKSLALDMSVVALVQVIALGYGVHSAYHQRTAALVFTDLQLFETVALKDLKEANIKLEELGLEPTPITELGKLPAIYYATPYPTNDEYIQSLIDGKPDLRERTDLYIPIDKVMDDIDEFQVSVSEGGEIVEIPASGTVAGQNEEKKQFKVNTRYAKAVITLQGSEFEIRKIGN